MQIIAYFSNGPLQGKFWKVSTGNADFKYPVGRRNTIAFDDSLIPESLELRYEPMENVYVDNDVIIRRFEVVQWKV